MRWTLLCVLVSACGFDPVSVEGKPPPCLSGFVEVDGRCFRAPDATTDAIFEDIGVVDAPSDAGRDTGMGMSG